jgi:hypothetical protein
MYSLFWLGTVNLKLNTNNQSICVERMQFQLYAVVSDFSNIEKTMKNPLFRAFNPEAAGIAQGRFLKVVCKACY